VRIGEDWGMAYSRSKMVLGEANATQSANPSVTTLRTRIVSDGQREMDTLRTINAHLLRELTRLKAREADTQRLADRDGLTGLYNRRRMLELLDSAIADAAQQEQYVGLLFIDLNGFKPINDVYGHAAGDKILTTVASRISARVRTGDIVCRYGGDEFVVILPSMPDPLTLTKVGDAIRERVSLPYWINADQQHLTAAIGESMYPHDGDSALLLLQRADKAMYQLKSPLACPLLALGSPQQRLTRRRNDKSKPRTGGTP
jgi:diguanylate cyclase